mmetsp:Transcript_38433/g.43638  ORF Transcript_38433/g.43638 Transcript_38433/m.43638 type:complete len:233 (+) Transcript_38433:1672-2370(+)
MVVLPGRSPVGTVDNTQEEAAEVNETVAHQEKHSDDGSNGVQGSDHNNSGGDDIGSQQTLVQRSLEGVQNGQKIIFSDSEEQSRGTGEGLQSSTDGGQQNSNHHQVFGGPGDFSDEGFVVLQVLSGGDSTKEEDKSEIDSRSGKLSTQSSFRNSNRGVLQITGSVGTGHDSSNRGEENSEQSLQRVVITSIVRSPVFGDSVTSNSLEAIRDTSASSTPDTNIHGKDRDQDSS